MTSFGAFFGIQEDDLGGAEEASGVVEGLDAGLGEGEVEAGCYQVLAGAV